MAKCACVPECDTASSWCRVAPGVFISLKLGQSIDGYKLPFPIPEMRSAFHRRAQRNAFHHRDARQQSRLFRSEERRVGKECRLCMCVYTGWEHLSCVAL